jgi:uncharacterized protein (DUF2147 family)
MALLAVLMGLSVAPVSAADPSGDWLVENGEARIRVAFCSGSLWGVISWEKNPGGKDSSNPDPAKRSRDTLGLPILIDMKPAGGDKWAGQIYNAQNGKMYQASVSLESENALKVRGCVMGGLFCGGETWARSTEPDQEPAPAKAKPKSKAKAKDPAAAASGLTASVCSRIDGVPGPTH